MKTVDKIKKMGFKLVYNRTRTNYCPGCGHSNWYIGRHSAECAFCHTAMPLPAGPNMEEAA